MVIAEEVQIRRLAEADFRQIRHIDDLLVGEHRAISWPIRVEEYHAKHHPSLNFVAEFRGKAVGFILGDIRGVEYGTSTSGRIDVVAVNPDYQRQGIGRRLVEAFCEECQRNQVKVRVIIREDDERLKRFWSSVGFHEGNLINFER